MTMSFDRFWLRETIAVAALNAGMNAAMASWQWATGAPLSLEGIAFDLSATPVFIAFLSTLLGTIGARRKLASGAVARPARLPGRSILAALPQGVIARSLLLAMVAALACAIPLHLMIGATDVDLVTLGQGVGAKVVITLVFSLLIVPIGLLAAAHDVLRPARRAMP